MRRALLLAILWIALPLGAAADTLSKVQEALLSRRWETAWRSIHRSKPPLAPLLEADYHQARGEPDKAWGLLADVPLNARSELHDYHLFLRAAVEVGCEEWASARRLLDSMSTRLEPILMLRRLELRVRVGLAAGEDPKELQTTIADLPAHPHRNLVRQFIGFRIASFQGRWAEAAASCQAIDALGKQMASPNLRAWALIMESGALQRSRPQEAFARLERALDLTAERGDAEPEHSAMVRYLRHSWGSVLPDQVVQLRGRLLSQTSRGRARWTLAGEDHHLPGTVDRGALLVRALDEAQKAQDYQAAAWLSLAHVERVFSPVRERNVYLRRAIALLARIRHPFPGKTEMFEAQRGRLQTMLNGSFSGEQANLELQVEVLQRKAHRLESRAEVPQLLDNYLNALEAAFQQSKQPPALADISSILFAGVTNRRPWDPDHLDLSPYKELVPYQELLVAKLRQRPQLLKQLLESVPAGGGRFYERVTAARLLLMLGRHQECRRLLSEVEREALDQDDKQTLETARLVHLQSLSLTGELRADAPALEASLISLLTRPLGSDYVTLGTVTNSIQALLITARYDDAQRLLDRYLQAIAPDTESTRQAASGGLFIYGALLSYHSGEPVEKALALLEQGARLCEDGKRWGAPVHQRWRIALLLDSGRVDEAAALHAQAKDLSDVASRLQVPIGLGLARGLDVTDLQQRRQRLWLDYVQEYPEEMRGSEALSRVESEVFDGQQPMKPMEALLAGLAPASFSPLQLPRRRLPDEELLSYLGSLARTPEGDASLLLPLDRESLHQLTSRLAPGEVLYHPLLIDNRLVRLVLSKDESWVEELYVQADPLRTQLDVWRQACSSPATDPEHIERLTGPVRELLWSPQLDSAKLVWLLLPRPFDGYPLPVLALPDTALRWTDGLSGDELKVSSSAVVLAGGHPDLPGTILEQSQIQALFPKLRSWASETGFPGLARIARESTLLHLSGHGQGVEGERGGLIDLGPLTIGVEDLFSLRLERHPLVTLATCDGGLDRTLPSGRSFSLITPLRAAGAGGVLASLWTLDDQESVLAFTSIYERLAQGVAPWRALTVWREEQRRDKAHPYLWSGLKLVESLPASSRW